MAEDLINLIAYVALIALILALLVAYGIILRATWSKLRAKGYSPLARLAVCAFGLIGLVIAHQLPHASQRRAVRFPIASTGGGSYTGSGSFSAGGGASYSGASDGAGSERDDRGRGMEDIWRQEREDAEEREERARDDAAASYRAEQEQARQDEWESYERQKRDDYWEQREDD